jgi:hypothetical protein
VIKNGGLKWSGLHPRRHCRDRAGECSCEQPVEEFDRSAHFFDPDE